MILPYLVRANTHGIELKQFIGFVYANVHLQCNFIKMNEPVCIMCYNKISGYINGT